MNLSEEEMCLPVDEIETNQNSKININLRFRKIDSPTTGMYVIVNYKFSEHQHVNKGYGRTASSLQAVTTVAVMKR